MKLTTLSLPRWRLHAEIFAARRGGWLVLAAVLTLTVCVAAIAAGAQRRDRTAGLESELVALQTQLAAKAREPAVARPVAPSPGEALMAVLPGDDAGPAQAQSIIALARQMGLHVRQATYTTTQESSRSTVQALQVHLPLRGSYTSARRWADEVLRSLPNVSIDSLEMGRESPSESELTIKVRLSVWHRSNVKLRGSDSAQHAGEGGPSP